MRKILTFVVAFALAAGIPSGTHVAPAIAMSTNCNNVKAMMMQAHLMLPDRPAGGDVDQAFVKMEIAISRAQIALARLERRCGKTAAAKESAALLLRESEDRMRLFRNQDTSL